MSFLNPWWFLALGLALPVIALYFLKLKRKRLPVSSTWLWMRSINDLRVNAPFQRLRKSLLLFLQLLLIAVAALALTRPLGKEEKVQGKLWVLLIDRSASMDMTDVEPSRLEAAKDLARATVRTMGDDDQVMVITFAREPHVLVPATTDRPLAERAITAIEPAETGTRITEAFQLAVSNAKTFPQAEIVLLTDGNFEAVDVPTEGVPVTYVPIGDRLESHNLAITALKVTAPEEDEDPWTVFVTLDLYSSRAAEGSLELYINGALEAVRPVNVTPKESNLPVLFEFRQPVPNLVEAKLILDDHLAADNRAWQVVEHRVPKVLSISQGNFFLEQALGQRIPEIEVFRAVPGELESIFLPDYDVVVCDGRLPAQVPEGRYLFFNCLPAWEGFELGDEVKEPLVVDWYRRHPITRGLEFADIHIEKASRLTAPDFALPLVESADFPLIAAWERGDTRAVIVAFDILETNWPLRLSFPLFIAAAVDWLARGSGIEWRTEARTGDAFQIRFGLDETQVTVRPPVGEPTLLEGEAGATRSFSQTERAGLYTIVRKAREEIVAVNLMDPQESSGRVAEEIEVDDEAVAGAVSAAGTPTEWWWWFALGVATLLLVEWFVYHRRIELF